MNSFFSLFLLLYTKIVYLEESPKLPYDYIAPWPQNPIKYSRAEYASNIREGELNKKIGDYDKWSVDYHQPGNGMITNEVIFREFPYSRDNIVYYGDFGDSSIWSGIYLASQAWRYHATGDAQAKRNAIRLAKALHGLHMITGAKGYIARYFTNKDSATYSMILNDDHLHCIEEGEYKDNCWLGHTSKDQYTGWMLGMAVAYDLIDDTRTRERIRLSYSQVVEALIDQSWQIRNSEGNIASWSAASFPPNEFKLAWTISAYHMTGNPKFKLITKEIRILEEALDDCAEYNVLSQIYVRLLSIQFTTYSLSHILQIGPGLSESQYIQRNTTSLCQIYPQACTFISQSMVQWNIYGCWRIRYLFKQAHRSSSTAITSGSYRFLGLPQY